MKQGAYVLRKWLKDNKMSSYAMARAIREDPRKLRKMLKGELQRVDTEIAIKIEDYTGGKVTCRMWSKSGS